MSAALKGALAAPGRLLLAGVVLSVVVLGGVAGRVSPGGAAASVHHAIEFLRGAGAAGPVLFALLQVLVAVSGAVPASVLGVAAGAVYGLFAGFSLAAAGSLVGAVIAFALSRSLFRSGIERLVARHGRLRRLDGVIQDEGWKIVCLLRLSPVMPFSATSYLLGLSSIGWSDYLVGTLASLPALFGYVMIGRLTAAGLSAWTAGGSGLLQWAMLGVGGVATLALMLHLRRLVQRRERGMPLFDREADCGE